MIYNDSLKVTVCTWKEISTRSTIHILLSRGGIKTRMVRMNLLILKETDVKVITDLMMGGDGSALRRSALEPHLSAISEAMNQDGGIGFHFDVLCVRQKD